jgi:hypothetical protein
MSSNTIIVTPPPLVLLTVTQTNPVSVIISQVGVQGPSGTANISSDANNGLVTGSDGGLFVTNATDLGTFN